MPFLTPSESTGDTTRTFTIPWYLLPYVIGLLIDGADINTWEQYGDLTPEECAALFEDLIAQILEV